MMLFFKGKVVERFSMPGKRETKISVKQFNCTLFLAVL